jgi:hypothetical protein
MAVWKTGGFVRTETVEALREGAIAVSREKAYSSNWIHGGPLADEFSVDFNTQGVDEDGGQLIEATVQDFESMQCWAAEGDTRLQAMCRAIVLSKLGDEVDVPAELLAATGERV